MTDAEASVSERVVWAVADQSTTDPLELPPLFETIDPDSLDNLVRMMTDGQVSFRYAGYEITVDSGGSLKVEEPRIAGAAD
jgi:hypothetical protein